MKCIKCNKDIKQEEVGAIFCGSFGAMVMCSSCIKDLNKMNRERIAELYEASKNKPDREPDREVFPDFNIKEA